ncbi:MAG: crosslink repair DNA glycosylase YcaQ family protein [Acidimicrobiia bacterium]|nr:crosslink repair DNA glycosylase YcaQ family protein [Acidimicrobiia bacterium]
MVQIPLAAARRIALGAQGLARLPESGRRDRRHFRKLFREIGLLQLDSVNVLTRSHYLPGFARLGSYDRAALDDYTSHSGEVFEYWGHVASLMPVHLYPVFQWRRRGMAASSWARDFEDEHPGYLDTVYEEIATHGPLSVSELSDPGSRTGPWWGHGRGRRALDRLFLSGRIAAIRDHRFGRIYDIPERLISREHREAPAPAKPEAYRILLELSARHHGIGTAHDLADYYRLKVSHARPILSEMVRAGELDEVEVPGWKGPVYLHPEAVRPRHVAGAALLTPFDPIVWERARAERLFGFHYRIEIYVPKPKRVYGYYVLPFLLDGELVARVDLKSHRDRGVLEVRGAFVEDGRDKQRVSTALAERLQAMSEWLDLGQVTVDSHGDLATALRRAIG